MRLQFVTPGMMDFSVNLKKLVIYYYLVNLSGMYFEAWNSYKLIRLNFFRYLGWMLSEKESCLTLSGHILIPHSTIFQLPRQRI